MGTIVVTEFISLDGVVEAPGGEDFKYPNWSFEFERGPDGEKYKEDESLAAAALLLGRKTYEGFAEAWPQYEGELADKYNSMPKYVVSGTLTDPAWNNTSVLSGDLVEDVTRLKEEVDGEISVPGSIQLAQGLLAHDLIDEIHLMSFPVILGHGRTLWTETPDKSAWHLTEATTYGDGVLVTSYQRSRLRTAVPSGRNSVGEGTAVKVHTRPRPAASHQTTPPARWLIPAPSTGRPPQRRVKPVTRQRLAP